MTWRSTSRSRSNRTKGAALMVLAVLTAEEAPIGGLILVYLFVAIVNMCSIWSETKDGVTPFTPPGLGAIFCMLALSVVIVPILGVSLLLT